MDYDVKVNQVMDTLNKLILGVMVDGYDDDNLEDIMILAAEAYLIGVSVGSCDPTLVKYINDAIKFENLLSGME